MVEYRQNVQQADRLAMIISLSMLSTGVLFQKFALPGSNGDLPISVLIVPVIIACGFWLKVLELRSAAFIPFAALLAIGTCDFVTSNGTAASVPSLMLFALAQLGLLFRFAPGISIADKLYGAYRNMVLVLALLGIGQFLLQFLAGPDIAFFIDFQAPPGIIVRGFHVLNRLTWDSPIFKTNGALMLEPSFFSQTVAVGIALEMLIWQSPIRLLILGAAILASFSGTGLTMLAFFIPIYAISRGQSRFLIGATVLAVVLFAAAEPLGLTALTSRVSELNDKNSSGWARFVSPFVYLQDTMFQSAGTFLLGQGPGSIQRIQHLDYGAFDPTWAKIAYEYGVVGLVAYFTLFYVSFIKSRMPLRFPLGYTYMLLGGYLLNVSIVAQLAALVAWPSSDNPTPRGHFEKQRDALRRACYGPPTIRRGMHPSQEFEADDR